MTRRYLACVLLVACGGDDPPAKFDAGELDAGDATVMKFDAITVEPADATLDVILNGPVTKQAYKAFATVNGQKTEVTQSCGFGVADSSFGSFDAATFSALARGGTTEVRASCNGTTGSTKVTLKLSGSIFQGMAPMNADMLFKSATAGNDPSKTPLVEYPLDRAIAPLNIPPVQTQWSAAQNDLFHLNYKSPYIDLSIYTTRADATFDASTWSIVAQSCSGDSIAVSVEGLAQANPATKFVSKPVTLRMSRDTIENTAIYYWASSNGNLMTQTFGQTGAPTVVKGECTSCHAVSRSGSRIGYSRCVGDDCGQLFAGFMKYDTANKVWTETMNANDKAVRGSYSTFAPVGNPYPDDKQALALLAKSDCTLATYDPDTGMPVPSNASTISRRADGMNANRCATMPDWSPDGNTVVFASTPNNGNWIDVSNSALATMSYSFTNNAHTFGEPKLIVKGPITLTSGTYNNFFFPSFSPDGGVIVFNAARSAWRNFSNAKAAGQRLMLTNPTGAWTVELAEMNGPGDLDITWPHWAPTKNADYLWVVFSSQRDYGHLLTAANSAAKCKANGVTQCKQIWIGAIDKATLMKANGSMPPPDPSAPPMWMPGQEIDADNISPFWTLPTSSIPN